MDLFKQLENRHGLPSGLLDSVWSAESGRGRAMLSPKGAAGHFQFMPATAAQYGVTDPNDLTQSATGAARMFADLLKQTGGDLSQALAGYNWGIGNVQRKGMSAAPAETRNYIQKVTANMGPATQQDVWTDLAKQFGAPGGASKQQGEPDAWSELRQQFGQPSAQSERQQVAVPQPAQAAEPSRRLTGGRAALAAVPLIGPTLAAFDADPKALAKGVASGFADVGNTILNAGINGTSAAVNPLLGLPVEGQSRNSVQRWNDNRQQSLQDFNQDNAGPSFTAGRLAGNVAATFPVGGVAGQAVKAAAAVPALGRAAPVLTALGESMATGGMRTGLAPTSTAGSIGNMGVRIAGGATAGGLSAGAIDPETADVGAVVGGALPPVVRGVGAVGGAIGQGVRSLRTPTTARDAEAILRAGGYTSADDIASAQAALSAQGPQIVTEPATAPQLLQNPGISQLQRSLRNSGETALFEREQAQNAARLAALDRISPVTATRQQAGENFGNALGPQVRAADEAAREQVQRAFAAVDPADETRFLLPLQQMDQAAERHLGRGTFGQRGGVDAARRTARDIGEEVRPVADEAGNLSEQTVQRAVPFREVQNLRSSIGEAHADAQMRGRTREAAALDQMRRDIDSRVEMVADGRGAVDEYFPAEVVDRWREALGMHADRMQRFRTGPVASVFRQGGDGLPAAQGGELAPKFFSPRASQADDMASFNRVSTPETRGLLKNYAITDAAGQTTANGTLSGAKFGPWMEGRSGAIGGLFDDSERATLSGVLQDVQRAEAATNLGRAVGSNTMQNAQAALGNGLLDSPLVTMMANRTPIIGRFTGPMLDGLRETAKRGKVERLSGLLADPSKLEEAIAEYLAYSVRRPGLLDSSVNPGLLTMRVPGLLAGSDRP